MPKSRAAQCLRPGPPVMGTAAAPGGGGLRLRLCLCLWRRSRPGRGCPWARRRFGRVFEWGALRHTMLRTGVPGVADRPAHGCGQRANSLRPTVNVLHRHIGTDRWRRICAARQTRNTSYAPPTDTPPLAVTIVRCLRSHVPRRAIAGRRTECPQAASFPRTSLSTEGRSGGVVCKRTHTRAISQPHTLPRWRPNGICDGAGPFPVCVPQLGCRGRFRRSLYRAIAGPEPSPRGVASHLHRLPGACSHTETCWIDSLPRPHISAHPRRGYHAQRHPIRGSDRL